MNEARIHLYLVRVLVSTILTSITNVPKGTLGKTLHSFHMLHTKFYCKCNESRTWQNASTILKTWYTLRKSTEDVVKYPNFGA